MTARQAAFLSLQKFEKDGKYSNIELSASIEKYGLTGVEKAFYTALLYGVIERRLTLDRLISLFSDRDPENIDRDVRTALYIGLYQLYFMDKIPDSAAVNESVSLLTRFTAKKNSEAFANAVLRRAAREKGRNYLPDRSSDEIKYLSIKYSVPEWICGKWTEDLGEEKAEKCLAATLSHPFMTVTVNTLRVSREEFIKMLEDEGIHSEPTKYSPRGVRMTENVPYEKLLRFEDFFFVQDEASQICCEALGMEKGESLLDACACPGGKSFYSAIRAGNEGKIVSRDLHKNKLSLIKKGAERLGIDIIETAVHNASVPCADEKFDRVLCDVPCSGLGVMAKKPEIRYKSEEETLRLPELGYSILSACSESVKDGGTLVYSTCTVSKDENEKVIERFLSEHTDFAPEGFSVGGIASDGVCVLLPCDYGTDGFFIAKMRKIK